MTQFCRQMGSKDPYFTVAAVGAQLWTATVLVPWQWPKWFGYKFSCWHAWEGMFCKYEVTYCSMKLLKSVFFKNLVMKNIANKVHKLHLAYLTKQISAHSNLSYLWLWRTQRNWQDAGHCPLLGCQLSSTRVENSPWPLQEKINPLFSQIFCTF